MKIAKIIRSLRTHSKEIVFGCAIVFLSGGGTIAALTLAAPLEITILASQQRVDKPVELNVSKKIDQIDISQVKLTPAAKGSWKHQAGTLTTDDKLVFMPAEPLVVDTDYTVDLPPVSLQIVGEVTAPSVAFKTEHAPGLAEKVGLAAVADGAVIAADQELMVELTSPNRGLRELELRTEPKLASKPEIKNDRSYRWRLEGYLPASTALTIEVYDNKNQQSLLKRTVTVAPTPTVTAPVKTTSFNNKDVATIVFSEPIAPESEKYITFSLAGKGSWRDDKTYDYVPGTVEAGKTYDYIIKKSFRSKQGGIVAEDTPYSFQTVGPVSALTSPQGRELSQARQTIQFKFDQPVDRKSVEQRFSLSAGKVASSSWQGNTYVVVATDFGFQQTITATVGAGVLNAEFGLPSVQAFSAQFTTELRTTRLNIPYYAQQQASTCTAAALRMALGYRGIGASEMELVNRMGYNPRDMNRDVNPNEWDDPDEMFVGHTNGGSIYRGAGPDAGPVAKAAVASGRSASAVRGINAGWIAEQVHAENPVIMFGATSNTGFETWVTPGGKTVRMNITSHVTVVTGVKGEPGNPVGFWVNDPLRGSSYWTAGQVQANINRDAYAQAVVVY